MKEFLQSYNNNENVQIKEEEKHFLVSIFILEKYCFEITIPYDVYEWFVSLNNYETKENLFSDWSDWYVDASVGVTKSNIAQYFQKDIECYIAKILSADEIKIDKDVGLSLFGKKFLKTKILYVNVNNNWVKLECGDIPNDFNP